MKKSKLFFIFLGMLMLWGNNLIQAQVGVLTTSGDFTITSTGVYEAEVKDLTGAGSGHDQIATTSNLTLDGTLDILLSGYTPVVGDEFEIMTYGGTLSGTFATINWPADMVSQSWDIDYGVLYPNTVTIYSSTALPVELLSFTVEARDGNHLLNWETASEVNNDFFYVEHSTDGREFSVLGKVAGQGNSSSLQQYNYNYQPTEDGFHYYRLQQVDLDGGFDYSNIVSVAHTVDKTVSYFPNPTNGNITFTDEVLGVVVYDFRGVEVLDINNQGTTFDLSSLPSGMFFIKIKGTSILTEKLIINKLK